MENGKDRGDRTTGTKEGSPHVSWPPTDIYETNVHEWCRRNHFSILNKTHIVHLKRIAEKDDTIPMMISIKVDHSISTEGGLQYASTDIVQSGFFSLPIDEKLPKKSSDGQTRKKKKSGSSSKDDKKKKGNKNKRDGNEKGSGNSVNDYLKKLNPHFQEIARKIAAEDKILGFCQVIGDRDFLINQLEVEVILQRYRSFVQSEQGQKALLTGQIGGYLNVPDMHSWYGGIQRRIPDNNYSLYFKGPSERPGSIHDLQYDPSIGLDSSSSGGLLQQGEETQTGLQYREDEDNGIINIRETLKLHYIDPRCVVIMSQRNFIGTHNWFSYIPIVVDYSQNQFTVSAVLNEMGLPSMVDGPDKGKGKGFIHWHRLKGVHYYISETPSVSCKPVSVVSRLELKQQFYDHLTRSYTRASIHNAQPIIPVMNPYPPNKSSSSSESKSAKAGQGLGQDNGEHDDDDDDIIASSTNSVGAAAVRDIGLMSAHSMGSDQGKTKKQITSGQGQIVLPQYEASALNARLNRMGAERKSDQGPPADGSEPFVPEDDGTNRFNFVRLPLGRTVGAATLAEVPPDYVSLMRGKAADIAMALQIPLGVFMNYSVMDEATKKLFGSAQETGGSTTSTTSTAWRLFQQDNEALGQRIELFINEVLEKITDPIREIALEETKTKINQKIGELLTALYSRKRKKPPPVESSDEDEDSEDEDEEPDYTEEQRAHMTQQLNHLKKYLNIQKDLWNIVYKNPKRIELEEMRGDYDNGKLKWDPLREELAKHYQLPLDAFTDDPLEERGKMVKVLEPPKPAAGAGSSSKPKKKSSSSSSSSSSSKKKKAKK